MVGGVRMRINFKFAVILSLALCLLAASCFAQSSSNFQSVSGDSARSYLDTITKDTKAAEEKKNDSSGLWDWGGAPRGSKIVDGKLVTETIYNLTPPKIPNNWLGDAYVDPSSGSPIYAYVDPKTGNPVYYYIDPKTGEPVYTNVNIDPITGEPVYASLSPFNTLNSGGSGQSGMVLPPIFSTNDPWA